MGDDKSQCNDNEVLENGVNGVDDVEMGEESSEAHNGGKQKPSSNADEEMTVVVPFSKPTKASEVIAKDNDGDLKMNGSTDDEKRTPEEPVVDPKQKAVEGLFLLFLSLQKWK